MTVLDEAGMLPEHARLGTPFAVLDTVSQANLHPGPWSNQVFADQLMDWIFQHRLVPRKAGGLPGAQRLVYLKHWLGKLRRAMPDERKRRAAPQIRNVMDENYPLW